MFMVLSSRLLVTARIHPVQRQAAADPHTWSTDLGCESACRLLWPTSTIGIYLLSPKADTHFTVLRRVEG